MQGKQGKGKVAHVPTGSAQPGSCGPFQISVDEIPGTDGDPDPRVGGSRVKPGGGNCPLGP